MRDRGVGKHYIEVVTGCVPFQTTRFLPERFTSPVAAELAARDVLRKSYERDPNLPVKANIYFKLKEIQGTGYKPRKYKE